jgi:hypothetical protein
VKDGKTPVEIRERKKVICKRLLEIREYIEVGDTKSQGAKDVVVDIEAKSVIKPTSLVYMKSVLDVLEPELPVRRIRKIRSFPGTPQLITS